MKFEYKGYDRSGAAVEGAVESGAPEAEADAREQLRRKGVIVSDLRACRNAGAASAHGGRRGRAGGKIRRLKRVAVLARQMRVLVSTGTPIVEALQSVERQATDASWAGVLADIRKRVEEGAPLSHALEAYPEYFDAVSRSMIAAGESGGMLDAMLERMAALTRQELKVRQELAGAMVYPMLLIVVGIAVLVTMVVFVMPRFEGLFQALNAPLPPTTKVFMAVSAALRAHWMFALPGLGVGIAGVVMFLRSAGGKRLVDDTMLRLPQVGGLVRSFITARLARVLGVLVEGHVPLLEALRLARNVTPNRHYAALIERAAEAVERGDTMSGVLGDSPLISPAVREALRSGERAGQIAPVLLTVADHMDEDNDLLLRSVTSIIEPAILIVLGLVVGVIAVSMFLPLFDLTALGGGGAE